MKKLLLITFLFLSHAVLAQLSSDEKRQIDSLQLIIKNAKNDSILVKSLFALDNIIYASEPALDLSLNLKVDSICDKNLAKESSQKTRLFFIKSKGNSLSNLGLIYFDKGDYDIALNFYTKSLKLSEEIGAKERIAIVLNNIASVYRIQGNLQKGIVTSIKSLKISEEIGDKMGVASSLSNIGIIYKQQGDYTKALDYYTESLRILEEMDYKDGIALCLNNIGNIYQEQDNYSKALDFHTKSLQIRKETKSEIGVATSLSNIGSVYYDQGHYLKALDYHTRSLIIHEEIGDKSGVAASLSNLGSIYYIQGAYRKALVAAEKSLDLANEIGDVRRVSIVAELLWKINKKLGNYKESLKMHELQSSTKDSILSDGNQKIIIQQEFKYKYEKAAIADSIKNTEAGKVKDALLDAEQADNKRQQVIIIAVTIGLALVALFLIFVYRRLQVTKKQKSVIEEQRKAVELQRQELAIAHKKLEEISIEINDSIDYAELIQQAVLPSLKIEDLTKDSFIYFNPKEKVSGDFFWFEQRQEYNGYAVADCTGHGIPGAFISMIGTILLNEIYNSKQIDVPNQILDELSRLVKLTLTDKEGYTMKDGMDISFAVLNNETKMLYFSGANNPVWIASKNPEKRINKETAIPIAEVNGVYIYEIKGDKQPIGEYGEHVKPFTLNSAHLEEGDAFYLFSDGYVDQFGGERNKKFKAKPFRELLLSIHEQTMDEQKTILAQKFRDWKGDYEQIDDVTVMGVRV